MNVGLGTFIRDGFTRATVEAALRRLAAAVTAGFLVEHKDDGTHGAITSADGASFLSGDTTIDETGMYIEPAEAAGDFTAYGFNVETGALGVFGQENSSIPHRLLFVNSKWTGVGDYGANINILAENTPSSGGTAQSAQLQISANGSAGAVTVTADALDITADISIDGDTDSTGAFFERSRSTAMGEWTTPAFNAANFTGSGTITWTVASGDVTTFAYTLIGKTMIVQFFIETTSVSGTGTELRIAIPGGFTCAKSVNTPIRVADNGTFQFGYVRIAASATVMACFVDATGTTNWAGAADTTSVRGEVIFEVS